MAISPEGYPTYDPRDDEPTEGPMWCETCGDETEHIRSPLGAWVCIYADLHTTNDPGK